MGIDIRDNVAYLIAQKLAEKEIKVFKMSRITRANLLDKKSVRPRDFNLDAFVKNDLFEKGNQEKISIEIFFIENGGISLMSIQFQMTGLKEEVPGQSDWKLVTFTSIDSQLYEWLWGLEAGVIVKKPIFFQKISVRYQRTSSKIRNLCRETWQIRHCDIFMSQHHNIIKSEVSSRAFASFYNK